MRFELRMGALCFSTFSQLFYRNILINHWNHQSLKLILYGVENFRLSWRFIVKVELIYGREHHVDVACIAKFSKTLTLSIFKKKLSTRCLLPFFKYKPQP
jgi:hypothetical protein